MNFSSYFLNQKGVLNRLGNYLAKAYSNIDGCIMCNEDLIKLDPEAVYFLSLLFIKRRLF